MLRRLDGFISGEQGDPEFIITNDLERSWPVWTLMKATERKYLPFAGGLLDQPDWLISDLMTIEGTYRKMKEQEKENV